MSDFEINYDTRPYLPDIFIKESIYNSFDAVNNNNNIEINSTIFVFNINEPLSSIYNDPGYLLYGIKKNLTIYDFPSLNFFYSKNSFANVKPYKSNQITYILDNNLTNLLESIGYNINNINENEFQYQELLVTESETSSKKNIIYLYFNLKNCPTITNYNDYSSTIYYNNQYWNILIYPYNKLINVPYIPVDIFYNYNNQIKNKSNGINKTIKTIDFDDRENIKYFEKIDYKYLENSKFTMDSKTNMETLRNYSFNIKNYSEYIKDQEKQIVININLNDICKMHYFTTDYSIKYANTYTNIYLNNKHINNYKCFCNDNNKYSYSADNKIANLGFINQDNKNYSCYNFDQINNPTTYQQVKNYYLNSYFNIIDYSDTNANSLITINCYLYKIMLIINPKIIDTNYLLANVHTSIFSLFENSNILAFGNQNDKLKLYVLDNIQPTNLYYINKYKIIFEFTDTNLDTNTNTNKTFSYIIILGIAFYNGEKISILDTNNTSTVNDLAYINYSIVEPTITLSPTVNNFKNIAKIYEQMSNYNIKNIKKYTYIFNYKFLSLYDSQESYTRFINFYYFIPNITTPLKTKTNEYYKNVFNMLMLKVNNFIKNIFNINDNFYNFKIDNSIKNYIQNSILFDENIVCHNCDKKHKHKNENENENENEHEYDNNEKCTKESDNCNNTIKYIEYFTYCPKINLEYLTIEQNYMGKYKQIVLNPYKNTDIDSFGIIPFGKYIKFNYINYEANYPSVIDEEFVKSIKTISDIIGYNFSLLVMIPYSGYDQDNEFYCSNPKYFWTKPYSSNIGGNFTCMYIVLTDNLGNPYEFNSVPNQNLSPNPNPNSNSNSNPNPNPNPNSPKILNKCCSNPNGIIYGIRLFNYFNYVSENLNLKLVLNLFFNKYINLTQLIILSETYMFYSDSNNVLWNINNSILKLHNFNSLKEIVFYDFKRFENPYNKKNLLSEYKKFNYKFLQILSDNKIELNKLRYDIKVSIYSTNILKTIMLLQKCVNYCEIIKTNIMLGYYQNQMLISLIKYNIGIVSELYNICYNLNICSGTFNTSIYDKISLIYSIDINHSLENINNYQIFCIYIINYSLEKLDGILKLLNINNLSKSNLYYGLYNSIYQLIAHEQINFYIGEEINYDIEQLISNTNISLLNNFNNLNSDKKILLLKQIGAFIKIIAYNSTKIDELFNLAKLMGNNTINKYLPVSLNSQVVKNDYIYNTFCYTECSNVPRFDIDTFLSNTNDLIIKLSLPINNPTSYINYEKAIQEGILIYLSNTILYFKQIINKIVNIYNFEHNILDPSNINIHDPIELGKFYHLLTEFYNSSNSFFDILYSSKINLFYEYDNLKISFNNLFYGCEEFLLYIKLLNDFSNPNILYSTDIYVQEDLYSIIKLDIFYDFTIKTISNISNLVIKKNPELILIYIEKIKSNIIDKNNKSLKSFLEEYINNAIWELKGEIITGIHNIFNESIIMYGFYYIIPYQDLLLYKESFNWASFNFWNQVLQTINSINQINSTIFETYYTDPTVTNFYTQALGYTYLTTPFKYININNTTVDA